MQRAERLRDVVELLEAREQSIFHRLALDLVARHPDDELITARLTNPVLFDDLNAEREYDALVATHYTTLPMTAQGEILTFIDAGPTRGADDEDYVDRWRLQMLERLPALPEEWQQRLDELRGRYGEPEPVRLPEVGFVGPLSPLGASSWRQWPTMS